MKGLVAVINEKVAKDFDAISKYVLRLINTICHITHSSLSDKAILMHSLNETLEFHKVALTIEPSPMVELRNCFRPWLKSMTIQTSDG